MQKARIEEFEDGQNKRQEIERFLNEEIDEDEMSQLLPLPNGNVWIVRIKIRQG